MTFEKWLTTRGVEFVSKKQLRDRDGNTKRREEKDTWAEITKRDITNQESMQGKWKRVEKKKVANSNRRKERDVTQTRNFPSRDRKVNVEERMDTCRGNFRTSRIQQFRGRRNATVVIIDGDPVKQEEMLERAKGKIALCELGIRDNSRIGLIKRT